MDEGGRQPRSGGERRGRPERRREQGGAALLGDGLVELEVKLGLGRWVERREQLNPAKTRMSVSLHSGRSSNSDERQVDAEAAVRGQIAIGRHRPTAAPRVGRGNVCLTGIELRHLSGGTLSGRGAVSLPRLRFENQQAPT